MCSLPCQVRATACHHHLHPQQQQQQMVLLLVLLVLQRVLHTSVVRV